MIKNISILAGLAASAMAFSGPPVPVFKNSSQPVAVYENGPAEVGYPSRAWKVDAKGNRIGPIIDVSHANSFADAQNFLPIMDGIHMLDNGTNFSWQKYNPDLYNGGYVFFGDSTGTFYDHWPVASNDWAIDPFVAGVLSQRAAARVFWNPGGTVPPTGNADYSSIVVTWWGSVDPWQANGDLVYGDLLTGWSFEFPNGSSSVAPPNSTLNLATGGSKILIASFPDGSGFGWPTALQDGGMVVQVRARSVATGQVGPLAPPGNLMLSMRSVASPTDPIFPGSNVSDSTQFAGVIEWPENTWSIYDFDLLTGTYPNIPGRLQPNSSFFFDANFSGYAGATLTFEDTLRMPLAVNVTALAVDLNGNPILDTNGNPLTDENRLSLNDALPPTCVVWNPRLDPDGAGPLPPASRYIFSFKEAHWLRKNSAPLELVNYFTFFLSLTNGDVDGNNEIGPGDFALLAQSFGTEVGDPNYNVNADLDGNDEVGPSDFAILSANFGEEGDEDLTP